MGIPFGMFAKLKPKPGTGGGTPMVFGLELLFGAGGMSRCMLS